MGYNLVINGVYWGYNPLILTFDPNFLGHPSSHVFIFSLLNGLYLLGIAAALIRNVPRIFILKWTMYGEDENVVVHVSRILQVIFLLSIGWFTQFFQDFDKIKNQMLQIYHLHPRNLT